MKKLIYVAMAASALFATACSSNRTTEAQDEDMSQVDSLRDSALSAANTMMDTSMSNMDTSGMIAQKGGIVLADWMQSPDFPDARLDIITPGNGKVVKEGKVMFNFKVANFQLSQPTNGADNCHCANSAQGQHIHNILNNEPYTAHYTDTFSKALKPGHYINLSFLSRSYHESLKHKGAYVLSQFDVGGLTPGSQISLTDPLMFYSRPKGEYKGEDTKNILLDFYLVNTTLSPDGNKVKATINGNEFMLTEWKPYALRGLPMGENTIKLELVDKNGMNIPGPYNTVSRTITLSE